MSAKAGGAMDRFSETELSIVRDLASGASAWRDLAALEEDPSLDRDALEGLILRDFIDTWVDHKDSRWVVLSSLSAEILGLELVPIERGEDILSYRWVTREDPPPARFPSYDRGVEGLDLDSFPARGESPDKACELAELAELAERVLGIVREANVEATEPATAALARPLPFPTVLVGISLSPWVSPWEDLAGPCRGCRGRELGASHVCLVCHRWGLDHLIEAGGPEAKARREAIASRADRRRSRRKANL